MSNEIEIEALSPFVHGSLEMQAGEKTQIDPATAQDLANAGLVRIAGAKSAPTLRNKMKKEPPNKGNASADGEARQSSSSPAAPASTKTTVTGSINGAPMSLPRAREK